jgi:hypothetical protein
MDLDVDVVTDLQAGQLHESGVEDQPLGITQLRELFVHR